MLHSARHPARNPESRTLLHPDAFSILAMSLALVTGGTGFVGSHLIESLLGRGIKVRGLVRSPARAQALGLSGVEWIEGDLEDRPALERASDGVQTIYHVAGLVAVKSETEGMIVNRDGTERLLTAAHSSGARFVFISSLAAGGPSEAGQPSNGKETARPVTAYGRSKLAAETIVKAGPLPWVIIRPPAVYGPRDREMLRLFRAIARYGLAPVFGAGNQQLSLIYGPDLADAIALAGESGNTLGQIFCPAHPEIVSSTMVVQQIAAAVGRRARVVRIPVGISKLVLHATGAVAALSGRTTLLNPDKGNEFFAPAWTCDPAPLTRTTGWHAVHNLLTGTQATAEWYRRAGWL
jgi:nucleoside-diphosphate-sugar epimerase